MTRKDYIAIANVIATARGGPDDHCQRIGAAEEIAKDLCRVFKYDNPNFDRERFLRACGVKEA